MCVFPAMIFLRAGDALPLWGVVLLSLMIACGVWAILSDVFGLGADSAWSWLVGAIMAVGFSCFAFLVAWKERDGWGGGIPFIPVAWNQIAPRLLFAIGGLITLLAAFAFLRKAIKRFREDHNDVA